MLEKNLLLEMYRKMTTIRKFEEAVMQCFARGVMHGTCHLCIGEEAAATGSLMALGPQDQVFSTHRGHGHAIAFGLDINRMMAEIFGKATGYCKGKGGSMHIADIENGYLGSNGIVGGGLPLATGAALAIKLRKQQDKVTLCFFGDGASNEGSFHESLNMASNWHLPVIFVCVNNFYGMSTHISRSMGQPDIAKRALGYGMRGITVDGNDVLAVYDAITDARRHVLSSGPMLVVENTYRINGHSKSDLNRYRTQAEIDEWRAKCPIKRHHAYLLENGATLSELSAIEAQADIAIRAALDFAMNSPDPDAGDLLADVFAR